MSAHQSHEAVDTLQARLRDKLEHKAEHLRRCAVTAWGAPWADRLDYDFYLCRDLDSGEDSLLERLPAGGCRVRLLSTVCAAPRPLSGVYQFTVDDAPAAELTVDEAIEWPNAGREAFVFFASPVTGRSDVA